MDYIVTSTIQVETGMSISLPELLKKDIDSYKNKNVHAVRAKFFSKESDTVGSFTKKDIDSYLSLVRRKVQEKCATTQELMSRIRAVKLSPGSHVTPNEFRYTLIKFGVILPQAVVDKVFTVFDSDRSGSMDFDEFAMWIMNSEFRPEIISETHAKHVPHKTHDERLRDQLAHCVLSHQQTFKTMKPKINFMELLSDIHRAGMQLTEKEARHIFVILDRKETGFVHSQDLIEWALTGRVTVPPTDAELEKR